jgi:ACT domain-containing protein
MPRWSRSSIAWRSEPAAEAVVKEVSDETLRRLVAEVTRELAREPRRATTATAPAAAAPTSGGGVARARGSRAVVTTTGKNQRGIVAKIAQAIADTGGDIVDISQTLVSDYFTMIIVVDASALTVSFAEFKTRLEKTVSALGAQCLVMHEDVVEALQRV